MDLTVSDDPANNRYTLVEAGGADPIGFAEYRRRGTTWIFTHTVVDPHDGRPGLGSTLVRSALDDVRARGGSVLPHCPFVKAWIERHPDYADLVDPAARR